VHKWYHNHTHFTYSILVVYNLRYTFSCLFILISSYHIIIIINIIYIYIYVISGGGQIRNISLSVEEGELQNQSQRETTQQMRRRLELVDSNYHNDLSLRSPDLSRFAQLLYSESSLVSPNNNLAAELLHTK